MWLSRIVWVPDSLCNPLYAAVVARRMPWGKREQLAAIFLHFPRTRDDKAFFHLRAARGTENTCEPVLEADATITELKNSGPFEVFWAERYRSEKMCAHLQCQRSYKPPFRRQSPM